jgi:spore coat protein H
MKSTRQYGFVFVLLAVLLLTSFETHARPGQSGGQDKHAQVDSLFNDGVVLVLRIEVPDSGVNSLRNDGRTYVPATVRDGATVYTNVTIRLKGGAGSYRSWDDKPGLTLKFAQPEPAFHGLRKFHLNNSVQDYTYLSEWFCSSLFRDAGVPSARVAHAIVELNGRRFGLYVLVESVDHDFLSQYFKNPHGNVYSQGPNADVTRPLERIGGHETNVHSDLKALAAAAREPGAPRLPEVLDLDRFLSFMAMEVLLDHWDGYTFNVKNYFVYHDLDTGKMVFMPHDMDQVMRDCNLPVVPATRGLVAGAILRVPETRRQYLSRVKQLLTTVFVAPVLTGRIDALVAKTTPAIAQYDSNLARQFAANAGSLKNRIVRRASALSAQLNAPKPSAEKSADDAAAHNRAAQ